jgi:hypothetical protein
MLDLSPNPGIDIPEDAVFEKAPVLGQDKAVKARASDAMRIQGDSAKGEAVEYVTYDDTDKTFTHEVLQDVEPVLESAKKLHLEGGSTAGKNAAGDFYHAARVPLVLVLAWLKQRGLTQQDFKGQVLKDFLNDPDHSAFRIWPGRV